MNDFEGRVAVVTGAASGIGKGLAMRCAMEGMHVVLADVEDEPLAATEKELIDRGANVLSVHTDVSQQADVETLAQKSLSRFGAVHLVCNNAGVGAGGRAWECTVEDWQWTLGVNLWGVIFAIRTFIPIMLEQKSEGHMVNTASIEGLWARPNHVPYQVSKHGVVNLSEVLYQDLKLAGAAIGVSVLCPGAVDTNIIDSWRNRPAALKNVQSAPRAIPQAAIERTNKLRESFKAGMSPARCAEITFEAIRDERLYVLTHPGLNSFVRERMENILAGDNPDLDRVPMRPSEG